MEQAIRSIVREHGRLSVTSHAGVNLMLALEDHFGIEFPERMLRRRTFENIASIKSAIGELTDGVSMT